MTANATRVSIGNIDFYSSKAYVLTSRTGWDIYPGFTGSNIRVPGHDGEIWRSKDIAPGRMVLDIFVTHLNDAGLIPNGSTAELQYRANLDRLLSVLANNRYLFNVIKMNNPLGEFDYDQRNNYGEVTAVLTPEYVEGGPGATVTVEVTFPNPIWIDILPKETIGTPSATSPREITLTNLAGTTAPITDPILLLIGPATNPRITDNGSGAWVQYNGTIAAGNRWRVNADTFQSETGTNLNINAPGYSNTNSGTNVLASTSFSGPSLFQITPFEIGTPKITFTGTSLSSATQLNVVARRKFIS